MVSARVANRNCKKATLPELKSHVRAGTERKIHMVHYADVAMESSPLDCQVLDVVISRNRRKGTGRQSQWLDP